MSKMTSGSRGWGREGGSRGRLGRLREVRKRGEEQRREILWVEETRRDVEAKTAE